MPDEPAGAPRSDWATLARLLPYLWRYRARVLIALAFMLAAKLANVGVPLLLKEIVDAYAQQAAKMEARWNVIPPERWGGDLEFFGSRRSASAMVRVSVPMVSIASDRNLSPARLMSPNVGL